MRTSQELPKLPTRSHIRLDLQCQKQQLKSSIQLVSVRHWPEWTEPQLLSCGSAWPPELGWVPSSQRCGAEIPSFSSYLSCFLCLCLGQAGTLLHVVWHSLRTHAQGVQTDLGISQGSATAVWLCSFNHFCLPAREAKGMRERVEKGMKKGEERRCYPEVWLCSPHRFHSEQVPINDCCLFILIFIFIYLAMLSLVVLCRIQFPNQGSNLGLLHWDFRVLAAGPPRKSRNDFGCVLVAQLCPSLCNSMDCSPQGSSVHGILEARILEWVSVSFSRGSSKPRDQTHDACISSRFFTIGPFRETQINDFVIESI